MSRAGPEAVDPGETGFAQPGEVVDQGGGDVEAGVGVVVEIPLVSDELVPEIA